MGAAARNARTVQTVHEACRKKRHFLQRTRIVRYSAACFGKKRKQTASQGEEQMIVEREELESARQVMREHYVSIDAEIIAESDDLCPNCALPLRYQGLKNENAYRAF